MEAETVQSLGLEDQIDRRYYDQQVDKAVRAISDMGDYDWFVSEEPYILKDCPGDLPPWD